MSSLFLSYLSDSPCPYHRLLCPARFTAPDFPNDTIDCTGGGRIPAGYDVYGFTGCPYPQSFAEFGQWMLAGAKFLWSVDDDHQSVPDWNPSKPSQEMMGAWHLVGRACDHILCSTHHLAGTFPREIRYKTLVAPNLLDLNQYPNNGPAGEDGPIRVLWSGSSTHLHDTAKVTEAVDILLSKWGDRKAQFIFFGQPPPQILLKKYLHRGVVWQMMVPFVQYWQVVNSFRPHIVLAPLDDCLFNRSKSNLRVLEAWALNAAVVASPVGEYGTTVVHGSSGLLASTTDEWVDALTVLVESASLRSRYAVTGRAEVEKNWNWRRWECRRPWREVFAHVLGSASAGREVEAA